MPISFRIEIDHGGQYVGRDDIDRAHAAAEAAFASQGINTEEKAAAAYAEYMAASDRDGDVNGLAWDKVDGAANIALTEGWRNPEGAYCSIRLI